MTKLLTPNAKQQFFTDGGTLAAGYLLHTYLANTATNAETYSDRAGAVSNANPIVLDARGEATVYLTPGVVYDYVLKTPEGATVWTREGVDAQAGEADAVNFLQDGDGAVTQSVADELKRTIRPEHFGAVGDGTADDTAAIREAITAAGTGGRVTFKEGKNYKITGTLTIDSNFVELYSPGMLDRAAKITMGASVDAPMIECVGGFKCKVNGLALIGSSTTGTPLANQSCVKMTTVNNVEIRNCFLSGAHDLISINGVCFYLDIDTVHFAAATRSWVYGVCAVANGIDFKMINCRGNTSQTCAYGFYFSGLGSAIVSDCQFSPSHCTTAGFMADTMASLAGPSFFTNVIFELGSAGAPAVYLKGDTTTYAKDFHFANCYFFGDASVKIGYGNENHFSNCFFTGTNDGAAGRNAFFLDSECRDLFLDNCAFEVTSTVIACANALGTSSIHIANPRYGGAQIFCELSNMTTAANLTAFSCVGGNVGTNATPIKLPGELDRNRFIQVLGEGGGPIQEVVYTGVLDGSGNVTITLSGLTSPNRKVLAANGLYRNASSNAQALTLGAVSSTQVSFTGGLAGARYRILLRYQINVDPDWT